MWLSKLPKGLQTKVGDYVQNNPESEPVFAELVNFLSPDPPKRRKVGRPRKDDGSNPVIPLVPCDPNAVLTHTVDIISPIDPSEIIFELPNLSFVSPMRRRLTLMFHLLVNSDQPPLPLLSVVNPTTKIPEFSIRNLHEAVKLCAIMPVLGNSTVSTKKDTAMLCLWFQDGAFLTLGKNDPFICTINLDTVKNQFVEGGKIPPDAEQELTAEEQRSNAIKPINEMIIDFLERQFQLCGVRLINFMPLMDPRRNSLNMNEDTAVCISQQATSANDFVNVAAYRGSKEGSLVLIADSPTSAYLCFGFKKPVLLYNFSKIAHVSYRDIAKFTFTVLVTIILEGDHKETLEFSMVDQRCFQIVDEFFKSRHILDGSFDEEHREKRSEEKKLNVKSETDEVSPEAPGALADLANDHDEDDEDEEDDENYTGAGDGDDGSGYGSESDSGSDMSDDGEGEGEGEGNGASNSVPTSDVKEETKE